MTPHIHIVDSQAHYPFLTIPRHSCVRVIIWTWEERSCPFTVRDFYRDIVSCDQYHLLPVVCINCTCWVTCPHVHCCSGGKHDIHQIMTLYNKNNSQNMSLCNRTQLLSDPTRVWWYRWPVAACHIMSCSQLNPHFQKHSIINWGWGFIHGYPLYSIIIPTDYKNICKWSDNTHTVQRLFDKHLMSTNNIWKQSTSNTFENLWMPQKNSIHKVPSP